MPEEVLPRLDTGVEGADPRTAPEAIRATKAPVSLGIQACVLFARVSALTTPVGPKPKEVIH